MSPISYVLNLSLRNLAELLILACPFALLNSRILIEKRFVWGPFKLWLDRVHVFVLLCDGDYCFIKAKSMGDTN